jgi:predicted DNA-binding protein
MVATVRLSNELEEILNSLAKNFHKKKSDIIREAIEFYAKDVKNRQKSRMQKAMSKCSQSDGKVYKKLEESLDDTL